MQYDKKMIEDAEQLYEDFLSNLMSDCLNTTEDCDKNRCVGCSFFETSQPHDLWEGI